MMKIPKQLKYTVYTNGAFALCTFMKSYVVLSLTTWCVCTFFELYEMNAHICHETVDE